MTVRVTRLMEYEYATAEDALADMERWGVPATGARRFGGFNGPVRSAVIGPVFGETADNTAVPGQLDEDGQRVEPVVREAVIAVANVWRGLGPVGRTQVRRISEELYNAIMGYLATAESTKR